MELNTAQHNTISQVHSHDTIPSLNRESTHQEEYVQQGDKPKDKWNGIKDTYEPTDGKIAHNKDSETSEQQPKNLKTSQMDESKNDGQNKELTEEEQQVIQELKARDQEVRAHENAHASVGGQYVTGGPTYSYQKGPDGNSYAIGGEVNIDTSPISGDPTATIQKMVVVQQAALAPADPSGQDKSVAASAAKTEMAARKDLVEEQQAKISEQLEKSTPEPNDTKSSHTYTVTGKHNANEKSEINLYG